MPSHGRVSPNIPTRRLMPPSSSAFAGFYHCGLVIQSCAPRCLVPRSTDFDRGGSRQSCCKSALSGALWTSSRADTQRSDISQQPADSAAKRKENCRLTHMTPKKQFKDSPFVVRRYDADITIMPFKYLEEMRVIPRSKLNCKMPQIHVRLCHTIIRQFLASCPSRH